MIYYFLTCLFVVLSGECEAGRRIFQGRDVLLGEFPYVANWGLLKLHGNRETFKPFCTCSIISATWAISAAHCTQNESLRSYFFLYYGSHISAVRGNFSKVLDVFIHPAYEFDNSINLRTIDICLLRTQRIQISEYAVISALDYKTLIGQEVYVAGHGRMNVSSTYSLKKPLQVFKGMINVCLETERPIGSYLICVSSQCGSLAMICGGDSGGPIIHTSGILGVNSASLIDCKYHFYNKEINKHTLALASSALISPVSPVLDWISRTINN
ncbi:unnamed protein product [Colias eurytheme]|nr:unnamed protein product [Colias eurytheme]